MATSELEPGIDVTDDGPTSGRSRRRKFGQDQILAAILIFGVTAFVAFRLGASLVGSRVFVGVDLFYRFQPWASSPSFSPSNSSLYISDQLDFFLPGLHEMGQRFIHADLAGWSSDVGGGSSLFGTPIFGAISPGRWLYLIAPTWLVPGWSKLLEMAFAAVFSYLLVRRLRGSKLAAGLAGFIYPMTGFMIAWTNWPQVAVASVIPMMFWSIERFVQDRRPRAAIPVALAAALLLFGGFPAVAGQTMYFAGGYAVVRVVALHRRDLRALVRDLFALCVAVGVGIGLTAFQLLPFTKQFLGDVDLSYREGGFFSNTDHIYLLSAVFPKSFEGNQLWVGASPMDLNSYVGAVVLLLGLLGSLHAVSGRIRGVAGIYFGTMIVFIIGLIWFQGPWSAWMNHLPIFNGNPIGRVRSQLGVPVAVLAAAGFDWLHETRLSQGWRFRLPPGWRWPTLVVSIAVTGIVVVSGVKIADGPYAGLSADRGTDAVIAGIPLVLFTVLAIAAIRLRGARPIALGVVVVSVIVQAVAATAFYWPTGTRSQFYPSSGGIEYLQNNLGHDRIGTLGYALRPNATAFYGIRSLNGHAFVPRPTKQLITAIDRGAFVGPTYSVFSTMTDRVIQVPGLDRMGVRYLVGGVDDAVPGTTTTPVPILGAADPLQPQAGTMDLQAGKPYQVSIAASALRGIQIPVATTVTNSVAVTVRNPDGTTVAANRRTIAAGITVVTVPLAADPGRTAAIDPATKLTVEITVTNPGVTATVDRSGQLRIQTVRPPAKSENVRLAYAGDGLVIWERLNFVPRIHWATHAIVIDDEAKRLATVATGALDPGAVILDRKPSSPVGGGGVDSVKLDVLEDSGDTVKVSVNADRAGYVVITDNIQSDFDAFVDSRKAPIVSADYAGGAVFVPAGRHEVKVRYAPQGRRTGTLVSGASALALVLVGIPVGWWPRSRRRKKAASASEGDAQPSTRGEVAR